MSTTSWNATTTRLERNETVRRHAASLLVRTLLALFIIWWTALAIAPLYRDDWLVENALTVFAAVFFTSRWRSFPRRQNGTRSSGRAAHGPRSSGLRTPPGPSCATWV